MASGSIYQVAAREKLTTLQRWAGSLARFETRVSLVGCLILHCGPTAIARFIVAIVVHAFNRMVGRRPQSHIGEKVFESHPALADRDTSLAIRVKRFAPWVEAPLLHGNPSIKFRRPAPAACVPMATTIGASLFANGAPKTTTTIYVPAYKVGCKCFRSSATNTSAKPASAMPSFVGYSINYSEASKCLSC